MELGNQVSCKICGGWAEGAGAGQRDNPREGALHTPQHFCVRKYMVLWCHQDGGHHTGSLTLDAGVQGFASLLLVDI